MAVSTDLGTSGLRRDRAAFPQGNHAPLCTLSPLFDLVFDLAGF
ncbi:hypothetical protein [Trichothermofontia sp.]